MKKNLMMLCMCCLCGNEALGMNVDRGTVYGAVQSALSITGCNLPINMRLPVLRGMNGLDNTYAYLADDVINECFPQYNNGGVDFDRLRHHTVDILLRAMFDEPLENANITQDIARASLVNLIGDSQIDEETGLTIFNLGTCREKFGFLSERQVEKVFGNFNTLVERLNGANFCEYLREFIEGQLRDLLDDINLLRANV